MTNAELIALIEQDLGPCPKGGSAKSEYIGLKARCILAIELLHKHGFVVLARDPVLELLDELGPDNTLDAINRAIRKLV